jgi:hypothetical protein
MATFEQYVTTCPKMILLGRNHTPLTKDMSLKTWIFDALLRTHAIWSAFPGLNISTLV